MRKIKSYFFISLDGVVESPDKWHFPYFDDEMGAAVGAGFSSADALLMGRVLRSRSTSRPGRVATSTCPAAPPPSGGCCVRASLTSSACSYTRSWSPTAWLGSFRPTSNIPLELLSAETFKTGVLNRTYAPAKH